MKTRQWVLAAHPDGPATEETWRMEEAELPPLADRQVLVRTDWLSLDPYMRGRINPGANYAAGVSVGGLMQGGGVGEVLDSRHPDWAPGDLIETMAWGWREHAVLTPDLPGSSRANRVDPALAPAQSWLSFLGMPGVTAWVGLTEVARPKPGETLLVSAASGAVGQVLIQLGVAMGARVVAIAGTEEKLAHCASLGASAGINHRTTADMGAAIRQACPGGVDVFWDNTGGAIHDAALGNLAVHARVVICGRVATVNAGPAEDIGVRASSRILVSRASIHGLIVFDWWHMRDAAVAGLAALHRDGRMVFKEDVLDGFERMPEAFVRMMAGRNDGKQLVRLARGGA